MAADIGCAIIQLQETVLATKRELLPFSVSLLVSANYFRLANDVCRIYRVTELD
jgi:hypothetical protein